MTNTETINPLSTQVGGSHYKQFVIQPVEFSQKNGLGFLEGCIVKRICRYKDKNGIEDLKKIIHEVELLIELEYGESGRQRQEAETNSQSHSEGLRQDLVQAARENPSLF